MTEELLDAPDPLEDSLEDAQPNSGRNGEYLPPELEEVESDKLPSMGTRITIQDLMTFVPGKDKDCVIGDRFLCKGGSCVIVAQTSAGKSSLGLQMAVCFAIGLDFFGIKPKRPLKSIFVQAENDIGDMAEIFQGVMTGMGLADNLEQPQIDHLVEILTKNLIIIRDQTNIGSNFSKFAAKLVEEHKPDLFWTDPLLSFFGDDISDQKAMSAFLRADLNPISERTGVIWMMLHHTGKPSKDAAKSQKAWSSRDFAYMGIGSSELSNWARAIICLVSTSDDEFRMVIAKRGRRSGMRDENGQPISEIFLAHSGEHICWTRIDKPKEGEQLDDVILALVKTINSPMTATAIVKMASERLSRGVRTCWTLWDKGDGKLGSHFLLGSDGKYSPKLASSSTSKPYADD